MAYGRLLPLPPSFHIILLFLLPIILASLSSRIGQGILVISLFKLWCSFLNCWCCQCSCSGHFWSCLHFFTINIQLVQLIYLLKHTKTILQFGAYVMDHIFVHLCSKNSYKVHRLIFTFIPQHQNWLSSRSEGVPGSHKHTWSAIVHMGQLLFFPPFFFLSPCLLPCYLYYAPIHESQSQQNMCWN